MKFRFYVKIACTEEIPKGLLDSIVYNSRKFMKGSIYHIESLEEDGKYVNGWLEINGEHSVMADFACTYCSGLVTGALMMNGIEVI